jgi:hypothetical protein
MKILASERLKAFPTPLDKSNPEAAAGLSETSSFFEAVRHCADRAFPNYSPSVVIANEIIRVRLILSEDRKFPLSPIPIRITVGGDSTIDVEIRDLAMILESSLESSSQDVTRSFDRLSKTILPAAVSAKLKESNSMVLKLRDQILVSHKLLTVEIPKFLQMLGASTGKSIKTS